MEIGILCMVILITGLLSAVIGMYFSDSSAYHHGHGDGFDAGWKAREEYSEDIAEDLDAVGEFVFGTSRIFAADEAAFADTPSDNIRYTMPDDPNDPDHPPYTEAYEWRRWRLKPDPAPRHTSP